VWKGQSFAGLIAACFRQHMGILAIRIWAGGPLASAKRPERLSVMTAGTDLDNEMRCAAALHALGPMERYYFKHQDDAGARSDALSRIRFFCTEATGTYDGRCKAIKGRLEYDYYLIIPFVGRVLSGMANNVGYKPTAEQDNRVGQNFAYDTTGLGTTYPKVTLRSNNDLSQDGGDPPHPHELAVQRRWKYATVQE
jgi:hypothetical protein